MENVQSCVERVIKRRCYRCTSIQIIDEFQVRARRPTCDIARLLISFIYKQNKLNCAPSLIHCNVMLFIRVYFLRSASNKNYDLLIVATKYLSVNDIYKEIHSSDINKFKFNMKLA